jgi:hypothetical protein
VALDKKSRERSRFQHFFIANSDDEENDHLDEIASSTQSLDHNHDGLSDISGSQSSSIKM